MRTPARISGVIFDFDGTIADTLPICVEAFRRAARPLIGRDLDDEEITSTFGPSEEGTVKKLAPNAADECLEAYLEHYRDLHQDLVEPFAGIRELLEDLNNRGVPMALVTGKGPKTAQFSLNHMRLETFFSHVEVGWEHGPRKVEGIASVLDSWSAPKDEIVYVGDSARDVTDSKQVGIHPVAVGWGKMTDPCKVVRQGPLAMFFAVQDLRDWIAVRLHSQEGPQT